MNRRRFIQQSGALVVTFSAARFANRLGLTAVGEAQRLNGASSRQLDGWIAVKSDGSITAYTGKCELGHGLYISNLWYLNLSDRPAGRITGMTRFATFRVQRGRIVAPVDVLRFDDSLYRMLGSNLEALTRETELLLSADSYRSRHLTSARLPGALVREIAFTL